MVENDVYCRPRSQSKYSLREDRSVFAKNYSGNEVGILSQNNNIENVHTEATECLNNTTTKINMRIK